MKKRGKSIFQLLDERNITYAVGVSFGLGFRTWFIIVSKRHLNYKIKSNSPVFGLGFQENNRNDTIERDLNEHEMIEFSSMKEKFQIVLRNDSGTIYELKDRSLKHEIELEKEFAVL